MKRKIMAWALLLAMICSLFVGCKQKKQSGTGLYYIDAMGNGLVWEEYEYIHKDKDERVEEALEMLASTPKEKNHRASIPEGIAAEDIVFDHDTLVLYFNSDYEDLTGYNEVLTRAAIVKTVLQIKGINSVVFYVGDKPLLDSNGALVGTMTADTFIDDYGEETGSFTASTLVLYFASADGQSLVKKKVDVYCNNNIARERLIIENLMKGVDAQDAKTVIPTGTKLLNITVTDGVCYVNFDSAFYNVDAGLSSDVVLYSIVNSLTELDTINKVQLLVNGESVMPENGLTFKLGTSYERDTSMVLKAVEREAVIEVGD